ncbi:hypothetical protein EV363DRAFT_1320525 [Boletus edulis]|uniref:Transmembrane protein n=1 Tax=Boletus edulis BED1 TaxID=1328754 RepID=A0AAD4C3F5_BOLED|nr:hypothetical protein EV363DRAFT_1320525 [Boletus edulis]KAF8447501.1 hypothetical protein L210DRAFT_3526563 [Boletus edulis BED1]
MSPRRKLHWASLVLTTGLLSVGPVGTLAQTTAATCLSSFSWMFNSKNQSPCQVAAYLQGACNGGQFSIPALPNGTHYTGPYADEQNPCQCSSVTYNVISACGICQNHTIVNWSTWDFNCSTVYPGVFAPGVPDGTAVPQWAFQDLTTSNAFNASLAEAVGDNPESTASHPQSTGSTLSTSTASGTASSSPTSSGSKSNTGAIAGGVVGGVIGVALIAAVVVFFMMKKKRSRIPPSAQFSSDQKSHGAPSTIYTDTTAFVPQMAHPKLYDPSDPSTFPATPAPPTIMTGSSHDVPISPHYSSPSMQPGGFYSGAPEI